MKRFLCLCILAGLIFPACSTQKNSEPAKTPEEWTLVWSDEFNYTGLPDPSKWSYDTAGNAWAWGNNELQHYTEGRKENAWVSDGVLRITARKEKTEDKEYSSARLVSKGKGDWLYGRFEIRAKLPTGVGTWPAIWMLPTDSGYGGWPRCGEIDIMENVGYDPLTVVGTVHTKSFNHVIGTQKSGEIESKDCYTDFHVYALEWEPDEIRIYQDDNHYFTYRNDGTGVDAWPFDRPFHLLLNLAIGGNWGGRQGVDDSLFPHTFEIDYVRVYQKVDPENKYDAFIPGAHWLDNNGVHINAHGGGLLLMGDTYYWFGEHKTEGPEGNNAWVGVHCYSSTDLYNWKDEGIALSVIKDDPTHPITEGCILERPKVIYNKKNDSYVMWFHLEPKGAGYTGALSGIAVSDQVTGPYRFVKAIRPNAGYWPQNVLDVHKSGVIPSTGLQFSGGSLPDHPDVLNILGRDREGGQMARDMTLFVDEDGKAYHIYSSEENSTLHISELNEDYTDCSGKYARFFPGRFMEAPAIFKHAGKYYLIMSGCTGWAPNPGRSAVAESIWGPWKELGNPFVGADAETSFFSQSTYIQPVAGGKEQYIYLGDRWTPENAIDGRYIWLPIRFEEDRPVIRWEDKWSL